MKICPSCQQTYADEIDSCPNDGSRLIPEIRDERECPYCAEMILKKARVCRHCGREVEPLGGGDSSVQTPLPATPQAISPAAQLQASGRATTVRPSVTERVPQFGLLSDGPHESVLPRQMGSGPQFGSISEPPGKIKHVALGAAAVLVMVIVGAVYFSEQKTQREQERAEKARQEEEQRQERLAAERAEVTPQGEQAEVAQKESRESPEEALDLDDSDAPQPLPVPPDKIDGSWYRPPDWNAHWNKVFVFLDVPSVEAIVDAAVHKKYNFRMKNGTTLVAHCYASWPIGRIKEIDLSGRRCALPSDWVRMTATDFINGDQNEMGWTLIYRDKAYGLLISQYLVDSICYPGGGCATSREAVQRSMEKASEKAFEGK